MRSISKTLEVISLVGQVQKSVRDVKSAKERTAQLSLESKKRIQESDKQLRDSIDKHKVDIQNIEAHYAELNRIQQEEHDARMRAVEEEARMRDIEFERIMAECRRV